MKRSIVALMMLCATAASAEVTIKFAKTAYSIKESAAYAELTVNKTGKEAARVKFATVCGTAQPGREYYATNGVLEWVEGKTTADCTFESCVGCGVCQTLDVENRLAGVRS